MDRRSSSLVKSGIMRSGRLKGKNRRAGVSSPAVTRWLPELDLFLRLLVLGGLDERTQMSGRSHQAQF
jgi:hypothetical protein